MDVGLGGGDDKADVNRHKPKESTIFSPALRPEQHVVRMEWLYFVAFSIFVLIALPLASCRVLPGLVWVKWCVWFSLCTVWASTG